MEKIKIVYWQDSDMCLGYLEDYPDYMTQGETVSELKENLKDLYKDLTSGEILHAKACCLNLLQLN